MRYSYNPSYGSSYYTPTTMTPQAGAVRVPGAPSIYPNMDREAMIRAAGEALPYSWQQQQMIDIQQQGQELARQQMEAERQASRANLWMQGAGLGYKTLGGKEGLGQKGWNWAMNRPGTESMSVEYNPAYYGTKNNLSFPTRITPDSGIPIPEYIPPYAATRPITESFLTKVPSDSLGVMESTQPSINRTVSMQPLSASPQSLTPTAPLSSNIAYNPPPPNFAQRIGGPDYGYGNLAMSAVGAYGTGTGLGQAAGQWTRGKPQQTTAEITGGAAGGALSTVPMMLQSGFNPYVMGGATILGAIGAKNPLKGRAGKVAQYAGYGATLGSFGGPIGTGIGAGAGALAGLLSKYF